MFPWDLVLKLTPPHLKQWPSAEGPSTSPKKQRVQKVDQVLIREERI